MPMTPRGPAVCTGGGTYEKIQVCVGPPRCARDLVCQSIAQMHGCAWCRKDWHFVEKTDD